MSDDTPVSWITLEPGTAVLASDGEDVGKVTNVVADVQKDIFSGISFRSGLLSDEKFAPADIVGAMDHESVRLTIAASEVDSLEPPA
jgi:sporulation protein YlmC with PRC-barrel domain